MEAYAALIVAHDALTRAKSDQPAVIADALRKTQLETAFGPIKFDAKGDNSHPVLVTQVQSQQYKVVWPADVAEAKPVATPAWADRH